MVEASLPKKRTTIYVEPNILREFKQICRREDESMSRKVEEYMARYVAVHSKGNPQLMLATFMGETKKTCFRCEGKFKQLIKVKFISGLKAQVCRECLQVYKRKGTVKHVYGADKEN